MFYSLVETHTPIGTVLLAAGPGGLSMLSFRAEPPKNTVERESELRPYARQLAEYFVGERRDFDMPLDLSGTAFQKDCWRALIAIPYGETRSYAQQARAVGRPAAFRAVGQANHCNPIAIVVPCHRVIGSAGKLTGYGGGLSVKEWLLDLERRNAAKSCEAISS